MLPNIENREQTHTHTHTHTHTITWVHGCWDLVVEHTLNKSDVLMNSFLMEEGHWLSNKETSWPHRLKHRWEEKTEQNAGRKRK